MKRKSSINWLYKKNVDYLKIKDVPLIGIVTRLTWQKGLDLIINRMEELMKRDVQVVILGAGDQKYEEPLKGIAAYHNQKLIIESKI